MDSYEEACLFHLLLVFVVVIKWRAYSRIELKFSLTSEDSPGIGALQISCIARFVQSAGLVADFRCYGLDHNIGFINKSYLILSYVAELSKALFSGVNAPAALSALCHWGFDSCASFELEGWSRTSHCGSPSSYSGL